MTILLVVVAWVMAGIATGLDVVSVPENRAGDVRERLATVILCVVFWPAVWLCLGFLALVGQNHR